MILAIDTSADQCAVALVNGARTWARAEIMSRGHAEALFPMIEYLLAEANAGKSDLTMIAVCTGPGSFTGIRAGVAAARGLALGLGVPSVGVSRLQALARATGRPGVVVLPMRGSTFALQEFDGSVLPMGNAWTLDTAPIDGDLVRVEPPALADPVVIARLAAQVPDPARPAPFYLRPADALPSSDLPARMLDP